MSLGSSDPHSAQLRQSTESTRNTGRWRGMSPAGGEIEEPAPEWNEESIPNADEGWETTLLSPAPWLLVSSIAVFVGLAAGAALSSGEGSSSINGVVHRESTSLESE